MPVRCTIHSSDVSTLVASSAFDTMRAGSAAPTPRTQARIEAVAAPRDDPFPDGASDGRAAERMQGS